MIIIRNPVICFSKNPNYKSLTLTLNHNPNPRFYRVILQNYSIKVTPDKNSSRKLHTSLTVIWAECPVASSGSAPGGFSWVNPLQSWKIFVHFHTKEGPKVKVLADSSSHCLSSNNLHSVNAVFCSPSLTVRLCESRLKSDSRIYVYHNSKSHNLGIHSAK